MLATGLLLRWGISAVIAFTIDDVPGVAVLADAFHSVTLPGLCCLHSSQQR